MRGHHGQIDSAHNLRQLMEGSAIRDSHMIDDERVQDPYCIRCQPQVMGACLDLLQTCTRTLTIEANAVTDNPLILSDGAGFVSGGNFNWPWSLRKLAPSPKDGLPCWSIQP